MLALINQPKYADLAICQIWAREFDEGNYLCSTSSMYRVAKAAGQTRERRRQATHPAKVKPELLADGPSQVWTWDITKLRGPAKGLWYHLYVIIDIFSRYNPSRLLSATESGEEAEEFIEEAVSRNGAVPHTIHADRGTSMTSGAVSELLANLGVTRSHSRPRTSNDNPYSEAQLPGGSAGQPAGPTRRKEKPYGPRPPSCSCPVARCVVTKTLRKLGDHRMGLDAHRVTTWWTVGCSVMGVLIAAGVDSLAGECGGVRGEGVVAVLGAKVVGVPGVFCGRRRGSGVDRHPAHGIDDLRGGIGRRVVGAGLDGGFVGGGGPGGVDDLRDASGAAGWRW